MRSERPWAWAGLALALAFGLVAGFALEAIAAPAAIIISDETGQFGRVDPIVSPGGESAHEHHFWGAGTPANPVTPFTDTSAEFRALPSNWGTAGNHSGMWTMSLFRGDGARIRQATQHGTFAYYQPVQGVEQVPPEDTAGVSSECGWRDGTGGGALSESIPAYSETGKLVLSCFIRGARDLGLTQPFPTIRTFTRYNVGVGPLTDITCGGPPGSSYRLPCEDAHIDYFWAWDRAVFEAFLAQCVRPARACGTNPVITV